MQLITHRNHIDAVIPPGIKDFIHRRYEQLVDDSGGEVIPVIVLVEPNDDITGPDYVFIGTNGLLSDHYEQAEPGEPSFKRPYEWVSYWPDIGIYELLLLQHGEDGYWILIPDSIVESNPDLKHVLTADEFGGLSNPQPI